MDPLSASASVLAVLTIAAQSTRFIYNTLSSIKDGPEDIENVRISLENLGKALERLSNSRVLDHAPSIYDSNNLTRLIQKCANDLSRFEVKLKGLRPISGDKAVAIVWKRLKAVLQKDELPMIRDVVRQHFIALTMEFNLLSSNATLEKQTQTLSGINQVLTSTVSTAKASNDVLCENATLIKMNENYKSIISGNDKALKSLFKLNSDQHQALVAIEGKLDCLPVMSEQQVSTMQVILGSIGELQSQLARLSLSSGHFRNIKNSTSEEDGMCERISRLSRLTRQKAQLDDTAEAQSVLDDLEKVIITLQRRISDCKPLQNATSRKRTFDAAKISEESKISDLRYLKRMRGLLSCASGVNINLPAPSASASSSMDILGSHHPHKHSVSRLSPRITSHWYATSSHTFSVHTVERLLQSRRNRDIPRGEIPKNIQMLIQIMPCSSDFETKLCVYLETACGSFGLYSPPPVLWAYRIVPDDSTILFLAAEGDLKGMLQCLYDGKASLRDCDSEGRTLLSYAYCAGQREVCKFLIEQGADVNSMEAPLFPRAYTDPATGEEKVPRVRPVISQRYLDYDDELFCEADSTGGQDTIEDVMQCRKLLLEAGADPSICDDESGLSEFSRAVIDDSDTEYLEMLLEKSGHLIDIDHGVRGSRSFLLAYLDHEFTYPDPSVVRAFIKAGANVNAQDRKGNSCLHYLLKQPFWDAMETSSLHKCLIELLKAGADPAVCDEFGVSVSDVADSHGTRWASRTGENGLGSAIQDLWDTALEHCGHDMAVLRRGREGKAVYTSRYTPFHYEALKLAKAWDRDDDKGWREWNTNKRG